MGYDRIQGVYAIVNKKSGRMYIGSSVNILSRWGVHRHKLNKGSHHNPSIQKDWFNLGEGDFDFVVLDETHGLTRDSLFYLEEKHMSENENLYNIGKNARLPRLGIKHSLKSRAKMKLSSKRRWKNGNPLKGANHPHTKLDENQREKIRGLRGVHTLRELGDMFGVSRQTISNVCKEKS